MNGADPSSVLEVSPAFWLLGSLILGLVVGSFLNVLILRLPVMMNRAWRHDCHELLELPFDESKQKPIDLVAPPSSCPNCAHLIRPWENIPLVSYLLLRGRCSNCKTRISPRYPIIETASALMTLCIMVLFGPTWLALAAMIFSWSLIALTVIDFEHQLLPDSITLPLLWLGLIVNSQGLLVALPDALWGAVFGYLCLWTVYWVFKLVTGKEGMGYGDFKLLAALGAWLGWQILPAIILLSSVVGATIGVALIMIRGRDRNVPIPFGPFLAIAGWLALLFGNEINTFYFELFAV